MGRAVKRDIVHSDVSKSEALVTVTLLPQSEGRAG